MHITQIDLMKTSTSGILVQQIEIISNGFHLGFLNFSLCVNGLEITPLGIENLKKKLKLNARHIDIARKNAPTL